VKNLLLILIVLGMASVVSADLEECPEWVSCPPGYALNPITCECDLGDYPQENETEVPDGGLDEGGTGFGGAEPENVPEGLLNIIYTFLSTYFIWILLFIIFLIILGVISKFAGMFTR
jgi:hypothetical protein